MIGTFLEIIRKAFDSNNAGIQIFFNFEIFRTDIMNLNFIENFHIFRFPPFFHMK